MELDWTTFLLEAINFLVLVWILKRFLYRPVLDVIARRRAQIDQTLAAARKSQDEALELKAQQERCLAEWERTRDAAQTQLIEEIGAKRARMMADLAAELQGERERNAALEKRQLQEWQRTTEITALTQASQFAASLLTRLASPELEDALFDVLLEDLQKLTPEETRPLIAAADRSQLRIHVASAFPLPAGPRAQLLETLTRLVEQELPAEFSTDPELLSGVRISIGPWVLHANLRDELAFFSGNGHGRD
ncbi:ATP synthase subunit b [Sulfurimicrobium lacus]|uniref:ATP synthase subunit b n=1 Tax=Sulfurimicrobium lacus TaxID=2715678 RepID=A0A6F8VCZ7_9PROT|nr:F0F1 ATP synthase subunit delta [Sulfurimicrobium lacus]BCB26886.1 ATP synthase subunit b [Sulfurimicrobium lacus]